VARSDFAIDVHVVRSGTTEGSATATGTKRYHVHKVLLTVGGHAESGYFSGLLRMGGRYSSKSDVKIDLDAAAAGVFPVFLDYLYAGKLPALSSDKAVLLLHLADYFRVPKLIEEMKVHVSYYVSLEDLSDCLPLIIKFSGEDSMGSTMRHATFLAVEAVLSSDTCLSQLLGVMDISFLAGVIRHCNEFIDSRKLVENVDELISSRAVASFMAIHEEELCYGDFEVLTHAELLPSIAPEIASQLLRLESKLLLRSNGQHDQEITSLQERCIASLVKYGHSSREQAEGIIGAVPTRSVPKLFALSLDCTTTSKWEPHAGPLTIEVRSVLDYGGTYKKAKMR